MSKQNKWYTQPGPHQDIVLSSRIRLARNLSEFPFQNRMSNEDRAVLATKVQRALADFEVLEEQIRFTDISQMGEFERYAFVESHIASKEFVSAPEHRLLGLGAGDGISIMVNEEDHLRIQLLKNGLNLTSAYQIADQIDDALDQRLDYAFDEKLGFLTTCPTNLGTGLRASVMIHLPALEKSGLMWQLTSSINKLGLTIRGTYGEGSHVLGALYQISNQITLGITESDALSNLESIVLQIIDNEKNARQALMENRMQMEDMIFRSYGVLQHARLISSKQFFEEISNVRLGVSMGLIQEVSIPSLNQLMTIAGTATLCKHKGRQLSPKERDYQRAVLIRDQIKQ